MRYLLITYTIALVLTVCNASRGEGFTSADSLGVHPVEHVAAAYVLNLGLYEWNKHVFQLEHKDAMILSVFETALIGFTYKMMEYSASGANIGRAVEYNTLGQALFIGTTFVINF